MANVRARPPIRPDVLLLVAVGGAAGALLRHGVEVAVPTGAGGFPWATFGVNVVGAFALGVLHAYVPAQPLLPMRVRALLGAGLLGGFTTFSAYAEEARELLAAGHGAVALLYLMGTLVSAVLAVELARFVATGRSR